LQKLKLISKVTKGDLDDYLISQKLNKKDIYDKKDREYIIKGLINNKIIKFNKYTKNNLFSTFIWDNVEL
jgi:hypothetical protein